MAAADTYSIAEDGTLTVPVGSGLRANDTDPDGDTLTVIPGTAPLHGSLTLNADGSFTYRPADDYNGPDSFTYRVTDGEFTTADVTVTLTVIAVNDAPIPVNDMIETNEDIPVTVAVMANDSAGPPNENSQTLAVTRLNGISVVVGQVVPTEHGTAVLNADGTVTYTPAPNYNGPDQFSYTITDDGVPAASASASGIVTINPVNDAPVASNDTYWIGEDGVLVLGPAGVLANDTDVDNDPLTVAAPRPVSSPLHGNLTLNSDGSFTYRPFANYFGMDSFSYKTTDGTAESNVATVTITVTPFNDEPIALADLAATDEDAPVSGNVLDNDSDVEHSTLTARLVGSPANGSVTLNSDGTFTYTPNANYHGTDSFTYKTSDGSLDSAPATVTITVVEVNDGPMASNDFASAAEDTAISGNVTTNDSDLEGDMLSASLVSGPSHGTVAMNADGSYSYTPFANYYGSDSFTYQISDGRGGTAQATVVIAITAVDDAPTAVNDGAVLAEDGSVTIPVLGNDFDVDNLAGAANAGLTITAVTQGANGVVTFTANGLTYTPAANYFGADSFTYTVTDPSGRTSTATVQVVVNAVNDAPVALAGSLTTNEDTGANGSVTAYDVDDPALTYGLVTAAQHGTVALNADGSFTYTPDANYHGMDSFAYRASDGSLDSNTATVNIAVSAVNDAPIAQAGSLTTDEDTSSTGSVSANDVDGPALTYVLVTAAQHGTVVLNADGSFTYTPDANYHGTDSFAFRASDGSLLSNNATVTIAVTSVNDAPTANAGVAQAIVEGQSLTLDASASFDPDLADTLSYSWDVNGDGIFGDATGVNPTLTWAQLNALGLNDGLHVNDVRVRVSDGVETATSPATALTINNAPPTVSVVGPATGLVGQALSFTFTATDPSTADQAGPFTYRIDWDNDGTIDQTVIGGSSVVVAHSFAEEDSFDITVTATDRDGLQGPATTHTIDIGEAPGGGNTGTATINADGNLIVQGGSGPDQINVQRGVAPNQVKVRINGRLVGTFTLAASARIHVFGLEGNDKIRINQNLTFPAIVHGNAGDDQIWGGGGNDQLFGDDGNDKLWARYGADTLHGGAGSDDLRGGTGGDALFGDDGDDRLWGGSGGDVLHGGAGNDELRGGTCGDDLNGDDGDDRLWGGTGGDTLKGGAGNDDLRGGSGCDLLDGGDGNDELRAGTGGDTLLGGNGDDTLKGGQGADWLDGGAGNDRLDGAGGDDILLGGAGDDLLLGGGGRDIVIGGVGADRIEGNGEDDILIAGFTLYDDNAAALLAIQREWTGGNSLSARAANIITGAGLTQGYRLWGIDGAAQTVFNDNDQDVLAGGAGLDWFFANLNGGGTLDIISDLRANELWTDTDF